MGVGVGLGVRVGEGVGVSLSVMVGAAFGVGRGPLAVQAMAETARVAINSSASIRINAPTCRRV